MLIGYARVSTSGQDLEQQRADLNKAGCDRVFEEKVSGAKRDREQLGLMLLTARSGDVIVATRLDRLARSTRDLLDIAEKMQASGVGLRSLAEPWADTTSPAGRMVLTIFAGIAEFERGLILQRTNEGRKAAKQRGVQFGRPTTLTPEKIEAAKRLMDSGMAARAVARSLNVHVATLYRGLAKVADGTCSQTKRVPPSQ